MKSSSVKFIGVALLLFMYTGCASIVKSDKISVRFMGGLKEGETILNTPDGQYTLRNGQTTVLVSRSKTDIPVSVSCNSETREGVIVTKYDAVAGILGNLVFGGLIGMGIDSFSNKAYDPPPSYNISPLCAESKAPNIVNREPDTGKDRIPSSE